MDCMDSSRDRCKDYNRGQRVEEVVGQRDYIQVELTAFPQEVVVVVLFHRPVSEKFFNWDGFPQTYEHSPKTYQASMED